MLIPEIVYSIQTRASVQTGRAVTVVDVDLAAIPRETNGTVTGVPPRQVVTHTLVQAGAGEALVYFQLTTRPYGEERKQQVGTDDEEEDVSALMRN